MGNRGLVLTWPYGIVAIWQAPRGIPIGQKEFYLNGIRLPVVEELQTEIAQVMTSAVCVLRWEVK